MKDVYITSAKRTAVGTLGKSLKNINAVTLGSAVITNVVDELKIEKSDIDEVIMGQVLTGSAGLFKFVLRIAYPARRKKKPNK